MSSLSTKREPSLFIFHPLSVSLLLLFKVITSVFVSLISRFPDDSIFDTSRNTIDLVFSYSVIKSQSSVYTNSFGRFDFLYSSH